MFSQTHSNLSEYSKRSSYDNPLNMAHSPIPFLSFSSSIRNQVSLVFRIPLEVPDGCLNSKICCLTIAFINQISALKNPDQSDFLKYYISIDDPISNKLNSLFFPSNFCFAVS